MCRYDSLDHSIDITPKRQVMKILLRDRGVSWKGVLLERVGFEIVSSVSLKKSMFWLLLEYFSLSG